MRKAYFPIFPALATSPSLLKRHAGVGNLFSDWRGVASHAQVGA